jgi:hypothetical protein
MTIELVRANDDGYEFGFLDARRHGCGFFELRQSFWFGRFLDPDLAGTEARPRQELKAGTAEEADSLLTDIVKRLCDVEGFEVLYDYRQIRNFIPPQ